MIINPYKTGSRSAKALKQRLNTLGVKAWILSRPPENKHALVVNWGNSQFDYPVDQFRVVNRPAQVSFMSNKIRFFENTGNSPDVLEWTRNRDKAIEWKSRVFVRTKVEASGGKGIIFFDPETDDASKMPQAPLYTKYIPKTHEFRLHVARTLTGTGFTVMLVQRKVFVKTADRPVPTDWKIRSHDNGFIFQTYPADSWERVPAPVMEVACRVMSEHFPELHFAALDVMYHDKSKKAWVIEGNTAPGLENSTINVYAEYLAALEKEHKQCLLR